MKYQKLKSKMTIENVKTKNESTQIGQILRDFLFVFLFIFEI